MREIKIRSIGWRWRYLLLLLLYSCSQAPKGGAGSRLGASRGDVLFQEMCDITLANIQAGDDFSHERLNNSDFHLIRRFISHTHMLQKMKLRATEAELWGCHEILDNFNVRRWPLNLSGARIRDLSILPAMGQVRWLNLAWTGIETHALSAIPAVFPELAYLNVSGNPEVRSCRPLNDVANLVAVELAQTNINSLESCFHSDLRFLNVSRTDLPFMEVVDYLISNAPELQGLQLQGIKGLAEENDRDVLDLGDLPNLKALDISSTDLRILRSPEVAQLEYLDIRETLLTDIPKQLPLRYLQASASTSAAVPFKQLEALLLTNRKVRPLPLIYEPSDLQALDKLSFAEVLGLQSFSGPAFLRRVGSEIAELPAPAIEPQVAAAGVAAGTYAATPETSMFFQTYLDKLK